MITGPLKFFTVAESIRVPVGAALTTPVQRSGVVPGAIAWDGCSCGELAVSVGRVFLSDSFPEEQTERTGNCESAWEVCEIIVQVIRCAPQPPDGALEPDVADLTAAAQLMATDLQQTLAAVSLWVCQNRNINVVDGMVLPVEPQGPDGGCVGSEFRILVALPRG